jgi:hypothetical protein
MPDKGELRMYITGRVEALRSRNYDYREIHGHLRAAHFQNADVVDGRLELLPPGTYQSRYYPDLASAQAAIIRALDFIVTTDLRFVLRGDVSSTGINLRPACSSGVFRAALCAQLAGRTQAEQLVRKLVFAPTVSGFSSMLEPLAPTATARTSSLFRPR